MNKWKWVVTIVAVMLLIEMIVNMATGTVKIRPTLSAFCAGSLLMDALWRWNE